MLATMKALRFSVAVTVAACAGSFIGATCGGSEIWLCLNPVTGKEDNSVYDPNHYVNGTLDPCHCFDPCGPEKSCPIVVDAGPLPAGCADGGADAGAGAH